MTLLKALCDAALNLWDSDGSPLPTPYDIVEFREFAWEPSFLLWIVTALVLVGAALFYLFSKPQKVHGADSDMWKACRADLERMLRNGGSVDRNPRDTAAAASRAVRRLLEAHLGEKVTALSTEELGVLHRDEKLPPLIRTILEMVQRLDAWRFAPTVDSTRVHEEISALIKKLPIRPEISR